MYMLLEADAAFIFILSVSISYIPLITGNYLPFSDRHQQASGTVADVLPSDEKSTFSLGGGVLLDLYIQEDPDFSPALRVKSVTNLSFTETGDS